MKLTSSYRKYLPGLAAPALLIALIALIVASSPAAPPRTQKTDSDCAHCHTCKNPTASDPCLTSCPRPRATSQLDLQHSPETVLLYELENEYEPVTFNHRVHAEMTRMGGDCASCHHYAESGKITACKECHAVGAHEDMRQPGLKGAYHRQCMTCHEEWSGETSCELCHARKSLPGPTAFDNTATPIPTTDPHARSMSEMQAPEKKVWQSTYGGGTVVTLHHNAHTEDYGIDCAACHHAEGCGSCHRKQGSTQKVSHSEAALHSTCNVCHKEMSCEQCHQQSEAPRFSHDRTGWPLKGRHAKLECRACHGNPYHFTKPNPECSSCHNNWAQGSFNHKVTGIALDDTHKEIGCEVCHVNRAYAKTPTCTECHGTEIAFPDRVPGTRVKS